MRGRGGWFLWWGWGEVVWFWWLRCFWFDEPGSFKAFQNGGDVGRGVLGLFGDRQAVVPMDISQPEHFRVSLIKIQSYSSVSSITSSHLRTKKKNLWNHARNQNQNKRIRTYQRSVSLIISWSTIEFPFQNRMRVGFQPLKKSRD